MKPRILIIALPLVALGCATVPKPPELEVLEQLRSTPDASAAQKRSPDLVSSSDKLYARSIERWKSKETEEARRAALMSAVKLKTAMALAEQEQARVRTAAADKELARSEEEYARLAKELAALNEHIALMQKLAQARQSASEERQKTAARDRSAAAELGVKSAELAIKNAELAVRTADAVDAATHATPEYASATEMLSHARTELKQGNWSSSQTSADSAKRKAEEAAAKAKPRYKSREETTARDRLAAAELAIKAAGLVDAATHAQVEYASATEMLSQAKAELDQGNWSTAQARADAAKDSAEKAAAIAKPLYKTRDEALGRDAASISGITVRFERRGDLQRLILPLHGLFTRTSTKLAPGKEGLLDQVAALAKKYPTYPVHVVGHTARGGRAAELIALSLARAQSVSNALVSRGIEDRRIKVSGQGANEPIGMGNVNNRVEVVFVYE